MMSVTLTPNLEAKIRERVASGRYSDPSQVVEEALRLLEEREQAQLNHLRGLLQEALEQAQRGEVVELTPELMDDLDRRAEERFLRGEEPDPDVCP